MRFKAMSYPCGFYLDHVFQVVSHKAFIRSEVLTFYPCGFYSGCGFTKNTHDVFIPPMCTIWHHRVVTQKVRFKLGTFLLEIGFMEFIKLVFAKVR